MNNAVSQRGLSVVNVGNDGEITNIFHGLFFKCDYFNNWLMFKT
jgi:hypothetical protein